MKKSGQMMPGMTTFIDRLRTIKRINQLIKDIGRNGYMEGIGKPEPLTGDLQGEYSHCINDKDRLVYHMENDRIYIAHCKGYYGDK